MAGVGDEEISSGIHRNATGTGQRGGGGRAAVTAVASGPVARDGGDHAGGEIDLADHIVLVVGDEKVSVSVHRDANGAPHAGCGGRAAIAAVAKGSVARDGGDHAGGEIDLADPVVVVIVDEEVPGSVHRDAVWCGELAGGGRAAIATEAFTAIPCDGSDNPRREQLP